MNSINHSTGVQLETLAVRIEALARVAVDGVVQTGNALNEARNHFGENDKAFGQWRESRLSWLHPRTALNYMQSAERYEDKQ
jgi:hypothetical protein